MMRVTVTIDALEKIELEQDVPESRIEVWQCKGIEQVVFFDDEDEQAQQVYQSLTAKLKGE